MDIRSVKIPVAPLLATNLSTTAQVVYAAIWQHVDMDPNLLYSPTRLSRMLGFSRPTVRKGLVQLARTGYLVEDTNVARRYSVPAQHNGRRVTMPYDLLTDTSVSAQARVLYGVMQTVRYPDESYQCKYTHLTELMQRNVKTIRKAFRELTLAGWLRATQVNRKSPIHFEVRHPITDKVIAETIAAQRRIEKAPFKGEAIGREWFSLLIDIPTYKDNAHLEGLKNPITGAPLEIDRHYSYGDCGIALEFHGPQHFNGTDKYTEDESINQQIRDAIKVTVCKRQGVELVEILPSDLSLHGMLEKIGNLLPLRNLYGYRPMVTMLEGMSREYQRHARHWMPVGLEKRYGKARTAKGVSV